MGYAAQVMLNRGVQLEKAGRALVMNYLQIVWAFVLSIVVLDYDPSAFEFVGAAIIICGTGAIMGFKALGKKEGKGIGEGTGADALEVSSIDTDFEQNKLVLGCSR
jgi:hypothetical protein